MIPYALMYPFLSICDGTLHVTGLSNCIIGLPW